MANGEHPYTDDDPVVAQYERWIFPEPIDDLNHPTLARYRESFTTLRKLSPAYWPAGRPREDLDILVAGCGTMAAAFMAHLYPQCRVVGIDISRASLAHEQRLKERYNLSNLTLHHCPVEQVAGVGGKFDYISCHGVLHHLPDPAGGLRALGGVLNPDGVVAIMLYAKYGRAPVYFMQELFQLLGLRQTEDDVAVVRQTLDGLPSDHPLRPSLRMNAFSVGSDAGLVDMFLHPRDRPYSVADCLSLAGEAGMVFQGWEQNLYYHPDAFVAPGTPLRQRLDRLGLHQLWQAMELLVARIATHWFVACRSDRDPATYRIPWDSDALLDWIPLRSAQPMKRIGPGGASEFAMGREGYPAVPITAGQAAILTQMDGRQTVAQCLASAGIPVSGHALPEAARDLLRLLDRTGYGLVCVRR